jgi:hypothetical protein
MLLRYEFKYNKIQTLLNQIAPLSTINEYSLLVEIHTLFKVHTVHHTLLGKSGKTQFLTCIEIINNKLQKKTKECEITYALVYRIY